MQSDRHLADSEDPSEASGAALLEPTDVLEFPLHRRVVVHHTVDAETGAPELRLYYGDKEISFDEAPLFAFGEGLARSGRFIAREALAWGDGYTWPQIGSLLQTLVNEGILVRAGGESPRCPVDDGARPSPLPPAPASRPRFWDECETLFLETTGRALELGHLELAVPVFRVAHCALDGDARQVGESNVFPKPLRVDVPTRWRTCIYPGTRHRVDRPMNVSALKAMRVHWPQMMAALARMRAHFLDRFPGAGEPWTVSSVEMLATTVLALPTYAMMRARQPVPNGALHPALSSLFRVTDGLRMVMHQMLFVPMGEPLLAPGEPVDAAMILAFAERNYAFHSEHGVCAGPQAMVEEFLGVLLDDRAPTAGRLDDTALEPAVRAALDDAQRGIDYALRGLRAHVSLFSLWPAMARAYAELADVAEQSRSALPGGLRSRLGAHRRALETSSYLAREEWRRARETAYREIFGACGRGLTGRPGEACADDRDDLHARFDAARIALAPSTRAVLSTAWRRVALDADAAERLATTCERFLTFLPPVLAVATAEQAKLNRLLGRPAPTRVFDAYDADLHNRVQTDVARRVPYLLDELNDLLGLEIRVDANRIEIAALDEGAGLASRPDMNESPRRPPAGDDPNSGGMVPTEAACLPHANP
ncbi:MAG: hypothetical protein H6934_12230 [Burkholderiaceae bacterium]|nr:hypothetical protein [Burkholderiaceae bacterium]